MTTLVDAKEATRRVLRFDVVQRAAHWGNALLFFTLIATAIPLYFGSFFGVVLERHTVEQIHLWSGLALPLPLLISLIGPWGRRMRADVRRFNYWTRDEIRWLRTFGRSSLDEDKFNPGQKLNAIFVAAAIVVMLVTGSMLQWFRFFSPSLRTGATFVHDVGAFVIVLVIVGHIFMALTHVDSLKSIFNGYVTRKWADEHSPNWTGDDEATSKAHDA
jgi:formate dehydrogenase subunit gamma